MEERHDLLDFLAAGPLPIRILTLESSFYLPRLRAKFPNGELFAMTSYEEVREFPEYRDLEVHWIIGDHRREGFPLEKDFFDVLLGETCLENLWTSYDTLMELSRLLRDTGFFLGSFPNIRYWRVLEGLQAGSFPYREKHLYAKEEVVKMLNDAIFKEISFVPFLRFPEEQPQADTYAAMGFDDFSEDLITKTWMFKACRSTAAVTALKELYTRETRRALSKLLHRIEYGVEEEKSLSSLWKLCEREMIFPDYLAGFLREISVHEERMRDVLRASAEKQHLEEYAAIFSREVH